MYKISYTAMSSIISIVVIFIFFISYIGTILKYKKNRKNNTRNDIITIIILTIVGIMLISLFFVLPLFNGVRIENGHLKVIFTTGFSKVDITEDDIIRVEVVDINIQEEYKPVTKNFGTGINNYKEGRFTLKNGEHALVYINEEKVLLIETNDKLLLLAPDEFTEFLSDFEENITNIQ